MKTLLLGALALFFAPVSNACVKWLVFDLGNTLVDTTQARMAYATGAREYLAKALKRGYHLGLISNIPESWGPTREARLQKLKDTISAGLGDLPAFPWESFDFVLTPVSDRLAKPHPALFQEALDLMRSPEACLPVFQGEAPVEVRVATDLGYTARLVPLNSGAWWELEAATLGLEK